MTADQAGMTKLVSLELFCSVGGGYTNFRVFHSISLLYSITVFRVPV